MLQLMYSMSSSLIGKSRDSFCQDNQLNWIVKKKYIYIILSLGNILNTLRGIISFAIFW